MAAFSQELSLAFAKAAHNLPKNIISLGDSVHERAALQKVREWRVTGTGCPLEPAVSLMSSPWLPPVNPRSLQDIPVCLPSL